MGYLVFENDLQNKSIAPFKEGEQYYCNPKLEQKTTKPPSNVTEDELNKFFEKPFKRILMMKKQQMKITKNILDGIEIGTTATRADILGKN